MAEETIRVVLADDHAVVRAGLRLLLGMTRDIEVVGEAATGREAVALAAQLHPDLVVMDIGMAELDGLAATAQVRAQAPAPRVLILTMQPPEEQLAKARALGASGYLSKTAADRELIGAIRAVARGGFHAPLARSRALPRPAPDADLATRYARLTAREQSVLRLVAEGFTGPQIGAQLAISAKTVDTYRHRIQLKVGLAHRPDYVRAALSLGLIT